MVNWVGFEETLTLASVWSPRRSPTGSALGSRIAARGLPISCRHGIRRLSLIASAARVPLNR